MKAEFSILDETGWKFNVRYISMDGYKDRKDFISINIDKGSNPDRGWEHHFDLDLNEEYTRELYKKLGELLKGLDEEREATTQEADQQARSYPNVGEID